MTEESGSHIAGHTVSTVAGSGGILGGAAIAVGGTTSTAGTSGIAFAAGAGLRVLGAGLFVLGSVVGVGVGGYLTNKHCNEMIEKFAECYKKNAISIANFYEQAKDYFDNA